MTTDLTGTITNLTYTGVPTLYSFSPVIPDTGIYNFYDPTQLIAQYINIFIPYVNNTGFNAISVHENAVLENAEPKFLLITGSLLNGVFIGSYSENNAQNDNLFYRAPALYQIQIVLADTCFPAKTPVTLDQCIINIEEIDPSIHTIDNKPIVAVTQTKCLKDYLVCFDKDALGANMPSADTLVSGEHKILHNGHFIKAKQFIYHFENVYKVNYDGEILYNVLMDEHSKMNVNNLTVETLHPDNPLARMYNGKKETIKPDQAITKVMNKMVITKNNVVKQQNKNMYMFLARK